MNYLRQFRMYWENSNSWCLSFLLFYARTLRLWQTHNYTLKICTIHLTKVIFFRDSYLNAKLFLLASFKTLFGPLTQSKCTHFCLSRKEEIRKILWCMSWLIRIRFVFLCAVLARLDAPQANRKHNVCSRTIALARYKVRQHHM